MNTIKTNANHLIFYLKPVSAIFIKFLVIHQMIALPKL